MKDEIKYTIRNGLTRYTDIGLSELYTKQLLDIFKNEAIRIRRLVDCGEDEELLECVEYRKLIKAVLATREHIPNKAEAKEIRVQKLKANKNR